MLLPAIVTLHALTRRVAEPGLRPAPWTFVASGRRARRVTRRVAVERPGRAGRLRPADRPRGVDQPDARTHGRLQAGAGRSSVAGRRKLVRHAPAARGDRRAGAGSPAARACCLVAGAAIAFLFNLPFAFVTKAEQMYLVGVGAAITLTGAALGLLDLAAVRQARQTCHRRRRVASGSRPRLVRRGREGHHARLRALRTDRPLARRARPDLGRRAARAARVPGAQTRARRRAPAVAQPARRAVASQLRRPRARNEPRPAPASCGCRDRAPRFIVARERAQRHDPAPPPDRVVPRSGARPHRGRRPARRRPRARDLRVADVDAAPATRRRRRGGAACTASRSPSITPGGPRR